MFKYNRYFSGTERTPFNFAQLLLDRCDKLFTRANENAVEKNYDIWNRVLKTLFRTVSFKLTEEEKKDLELKIKNITNKIIQLKDRTNIIIIADIEENLSSVEIEIISFMYKYGLYYPKYEKKDWEVEAMEEDI